MDQLQQGDVIAKRINKIPEGTQEVPRVNGRIVVMHGESGHTHVIDGVDAMFYEKDGKNYLVTTRAVTQTHEEHAPIIYEPGIWEIGQIQEKNWINGLVSRISD